MSSDSGLLAFLNSPFSTLHVDNRLIEYMVALTVDNSRYICVGELLLLLILLNHIDVFAGILLFLLYHETSAGQFGNAVRYLLQLRHCRRIKLVFLGRKKE